MWIIRSITYILRIISLLIYNIVWIINIHLQHCVDYQLINLRHCVDYEFVIYNIVCIYTQQVYQHYHKDYQLLN